MIGYIFSLSRKIKNFNGYVFTQNDFWFSFNLKQKLVANVKSFVLSFDFWRQIKSLNKSLIKSLIFWSVFLVE